jgi:hypothetical protein
VLLKMIDFFLIHLVCLARYAILFKDRGHFFLLASAEDLQISVVAGVVGCVIRGFLCRVGLIEWTGDANAAAPERLRAHGVVVGSERKRGAMGELDAKEEEDEQAWQVSHGDWQEESDESPTTAALYKRCVL